MTWYVFCLFCVVQPFHRGAHDVSSFPPHFIPVLSTMQGCPRFRPPPPLNFLPPPPTPPPSLLTLRPALPCQSSKRQYKGLPIAFRIPFHSSCMNTEIPLACPLGSSPRSLNSQITPRRLCLPADPLNCARFGSVLVTETRRFRRPTQLETPLITYPASYTVTYSPSPFLLNPYTHPRDCYPATISADTWSQISSSSTAGPYEPRAVYFPPNPVSLHP